MRGAEDLPPDRANRIADAIEDIVSNVTRLRELQSLSRDEYKESASQDLRDSVERKFVKLTSAVVDVGEELLKHERGGVPQLRKEVITGLEEEGLITEGLADRLRDAVEFRDVLAHTYGPIVNDDLVYDALQHSLDRFGEFVDAVDDYLSG